MKIKNEQLLTQLEKRSNAKSKSARFVTEPKFNKQNERFINHSKRTYGSEITKTG